MNRKALKLFCLASGITLGAHAAPIYTFEDGKKPGGSWDASISIVENPSSDATNSSSNCLKATFTETWGAIASFTDQPDYSKYGLTFLVYLEDQGEVGVRAYDGKTNFEIKQSVFEGKKWTRVSYDFSKLTSTSNSITIFTGGKNTIYVDDIELVPLDQLSQSEFKCDGMDVPYKYDQVAIGGGGFISGIIAAGNAKYARTDVGGAYKWNEANCSWKAVNTFISEDDKGYYSIEALAIDPQNTDNVYMLAGCQYFSDAKTAIMLTKDGGKTFKTVDVSEFLRVHGNGDGRNCGERIAVDPNNSNIIFCGGRAGASPLIKSTDGGMTWSAVSTFPSAAFNNKINWPIWTSNSVNTTADENGITAVVFDKKSLSGGKSNRIFVSISQKNSSNVYVSEDGGSTWSAVSAIPTTYIPCRMKMDPDGNLLIACSSAKAYGTAGAIYRYNPTSKTVEDISPVQSHNYAYGDVAVSSQDAKKLVVSTNSTWIPQNWDNGQKPNGDIVWTSTDGGATWRSLQDNMTLTNNHVTWVPGYALHWCGSICMDPNDDSKASFASGNGIFTCNNIFCEGTPTFYFDVNGLEETVPLDMVSIPNGDLLSVIGDYTGFVHKDITKFAPIHDPAPGTSAGINYYSKDPNVRIRLSQNGCAEWDDPYKKTKCLSTYAFMYSLTGNDGWKPMYYTDYNYVNQYNGQTYYAGEGKCAVTKKNDIYRFFVIPQPGESSVYYSDDFGASWTKIAGTAAATHIQVDPVNDAYVYLGGKNTFFVSSNYGENFTSQNITNNDFGRITIVPNHEGLIYIACGGNGMKMSTDHGTSWSNMKYVTACSAVGCGKGLTDDTYAIYMWGKANGCETGLYRSIDTGASWQRINDENNQFGGPGNGQFVIGDWNTFGRFYMSSIGLGIIYGDLENNFKVKTWQCFEDNTSCKKESVDVEEITSNSSVLYPNPFAESFTLMESGNYTVKNTLGQTIESGYADGNTTLGSDWISGLYVLNVNGQTYKIIKK